MNNKTFNGQNQRAAQPAQVNNNVVTTKGSFFAEHKNGILIGTAVTAAAVGGFFLYRGIKKRRAAKKGQAQQAPAAEAPQK